MNRYNDASSSSIWLSVYSSILLPVASDALLPLAFDEMFQPMAGRFLPCTGSSASRTGPPTVGPLRAGETID